MVFWCFSFGIFESYEDWGRKLVSVSKGGSDGNSYCVDNDVSPGSTTVYPVVGEENLHSSLAIFEDYSTEDSISKIFESQGKGPVEILLDESLAETAVIFELRNMYLCCFHIGLPCAGQVTVFLISYFIACYHCSAIRGYCK